MKFLGCAAIALLVLFAFSTIAFAERGSGSGEPEFEVISEISSQGNDDNSAPGTECQTVADCGMGAASCRNGYCSQYDDHGCVPDGGYTWCESKQKCLRGWEEDCSSDSNAEIADMPNPASKKCIDDGYELEIEDEDGGQVGYCKFNDGTQCEEWKYFRGECGPGNAGEHRDPSSYTLQHCIVNENAICTMEYAPVCGKDGKTYGNKCMAQAACIKIVGIGECKDFTGAEVNPDEDNLEVDGTDGQKHTLQITSQGEKKFVRFRYQANEELIPADLNLNVMGNKFYVVQNGTTYEVKVSPPEMFGKFQFKIQEKPNVKLKSMELKYQNNKPVYEVTADVPFNLFGFIPMQIESKYILNSDDGSLVQENEPWFTMLGSKGFSMK